MATDTLFTDMELLGNFFVGKTFLAAELKDRTHLSRKRCNLSFDKLSQHFFSYQMVCADLSMCQKSLKRMDIFVRTPTFQLMVDHSVPDSLIEIGCQIFFNMERFPI